MIIMSFAYYRSDVGVIDWSATSSAFDFATIVNINFDGIYFLRWLY